MNSKAIKRQLLAAIAMVLVAAIALGSSTYAWFVSNNAVTATGIDVTTTSSVPNLYITSSGKTTDAMSAVGTNPTKLFPVSTNSAKDNEFYETLHWTSASGDNTHAVADQYQAALKHETGKTVYADYTFVLGVTNGTMDIYFDNDTNATTLAAAAKMGTAGRFAIKFDNGDWILFKVKGTATNSGYYTDKASEGGNGDYWVTGAGDSTKCSAASYADFGAYSGSISDTGVASAGTKKLTTISSTDTDGQTVTVRVWYEGCDKDCVSENAGTGIASAIKGNLGFVGVQVDDTQSGGGG